MAALDGSLEFRDISMEFPGVKALSHMSFQARAGEVVAFLGENGAGKSTLLKILNGDYQQTEGDYFIDGQRVHFTSPRQAIAAGVGVIYQERQVVPEVTVAENIYMGNLPTKGPGLVDFKTLNAQAQAVIEEFGLPFRATDLVGRLSVAHQQMVEIMKAYSRNLKIIAFDEPTASLSDKEVESLFRIIEKLKAEGKIILYVSHRLKEIFRMCDRVIVFKDGCYVDERDPRRTTEEELVRLMVGRDLGGVFGGIQRNDQIGDTLLEVRHLGTDMLKDISFSIHRGEILGFSGLVGSGRTELARAVFGADPMGEGEVLLEGKPIRCAGPENALRLGIALCTEDRKNEGIVAVRSVSDNLSMIALRSVCRLGVIDRRGERKMVEDGVRSLNVKTAAVSTEIQYLSGGNQQKVILARCLASRPRLLILDEPTKGIDVGAKQEIYNIVCALAREGIAIWVISSELPEIIGLCDRILVMHEGRITGEVPRSEATEEVLLSYAMR